MKLANRARRRVMTKSKQRHEDVAKNNVYYKNRHNGILVCEYMVDFLEQTWLVWWILALFAILHWFDDSTGSRDVGIGGRFRRR